MTEQNIANVEPEISPEQQALIDQLLAIETALGSMPLAQSKIIRGKVSEVKEKALREEAQTELARQTTWVASLGLTIPTDMMEQYGIDTISILFKRDGSKDYRVYSPAATQASTGKAPRMPKDGTEKTTRTRATGGMGQNELATRYWLEQGKVTMSDKLAQFLANPKPDKDNSYRPDSFFASVKARFGPAPEGWTP